LRGLCFADLSEAAAAFALDPGLAFRCNVCGAVHRAKGRRWHTCAEGFAQKWGLLWYFVRQGGLNEELRARPDALLERSWGPSLAEVLALRHLLRGTDPPQPGCTDWHLLPTDNLEMRLVCLLSLENSVAAAVLRNAWDRWWEQVEGAIREAKVQLMRMVGRLEPWEGFDPAKVKRDDLLAAVVADRGGEYGCRVNRMLVGRHAIVWKPDRPRHTIQVRNAQPEVRDEVVVRFYHLGCRVRVSYPGALAGVGAERPLEWFFGVVEERLPEVMQAS